MTSIGKWSLSGVGLTTVMSTELNSLGSGSQATSSSAYANQTNLDLYVDIEVLLASLSPSANAFIALYIAEAVDGSNYPAPSAADLRLSSTQLLVQIPIGTTATTAQRVTARNVLIPPATFKIILDNQTGVSLNASGNTVKFLPYDVNLNG